MRVINFKELELDAWQNPQWLVLFSTENVDIQVLRQIRERFPSLLILGASSFHGIFTHCGYQQGSYGLLDEGDARIHFESIFVRALPEDDWKVLACEAAKKLGTVENVESDVILMQSTPGHEERIIDGILEGLGEEVLVYGGTAGNSEKLPEPFVIYNDEISFSGFWLVLITGSPSPECLMLMGGYLPTLNSGVVTQAKDRTIQTIDFRPAMEVYNEWTDSIFEPYLRRGGDLPKTTAMYPLGRTLENEPNCGYWLYHPISVTPGTKNLTLFAEFPVNTRITLMRGSERMLINRMSAVTREALENVDPSKVRGAIVIFCAGCACIIQNEMEQVCAQVQEVLGDVPFIGCSSNGEQGRLRGFKRCYHGNMMCGVILFMES